MAQTISPQVSEHYLSKLDAMLEGHYQAVFSDERIRQLSQQFSREGYCNASQVVPLELLQEVKAEALRLLQIFAKRIDVHIAETGGTLRAMSTVSAPQISSQGVLIPFLYQSTTLINLLERIAQNKVTLCPWEGEKYIINRHERRGDTHGWHWGDYPYALIWVLEAPPLSYGGMLQCIPHTNWNKSDPRVHEYLCENVIRTYPHSSGEIYFLKTDTTLHRTVPLKEDVMRIILNFTYSTPDHPGVSHETMHSMYEV